MIIYVETLDQESLQTALDTQCGQGIFITGRAKLPDGTRPVYYEYADTTAPEIVAEAAVVAAQQDQEYLSSLRSSLLNSIGRAATKSRQRQPACAYTATDQAAAQTWLANPATACPLVVEVRSVSNNVTTTLAAQQIVSIYNNYLAYDGEVDSILSQGQSNILAATTVMDCKNTYQISSSQLSTLENTSYGDS